MPRHALRPSHALARLLRERREELGLSARAVTKRSADLGERIPFPTLLRIEQGRQEPGVRRFYALLTLYDLPFEIVPDLLELDALAAEPPDISDAELLYERGTELWRAGQVGPALAHLFALRMLPPGSTDTLVRQKCLLGFAVAANKLGRTQLSHRLIESLLREPPHESLRVYVLVQAATNWHHLGSQDVASAMLTQARAVLQPGRRREAALIDHEAARQWSHAGDHRKALAAARSAAEHYTKAGDAFGRCLVAGVRVDALLMAGRTREALEEARASRSDAKRRGYGAVAARRLVDEGRALLASASDRAVAVLQAALAEAVALDHPPVRFSAHYWLWKAYEAAGEAERARVERDAACSYARVVHDNSVEIQEVRALMSGGEKLHDARPMDQTARRPRRRA